MHTYVPCVHGMQGGHVSRSQHTQGRHTRPHVVSHQSLPHTLSTRPPQARHPSHVPVCGGPSRTARNCRALRLTPIQPPTSGNCAHGTDLSPVSTSQLLQTPRPWHVTPLLLVPCGRHSQASRIADGARVHVFGAPSHQVQGGWHNSTHRMPVACASCVC